VPVTRCSGRVPARPHDVASTIPAGVEDGTRIRLAARVSAGAREGRRRPIHLLSIGGHGFFQRDGAELQGRVTISMVTARARRAIEVRQSDGGRPGEGTRGTSRAALPAPDKWHAGCGRDRWRHVCASIGRGRPQTSHKRQREAAGRIRPAVVQGNATDSRRNSSVMSQGGFGIGLTRPDPSTSPGLQGSYPMPIW